VSVAASAPCPRIAFSIGDPNGFGPGLVPRMALRAQRSFRKEP